MKKIFALFIVIATVWTLTVGIDSARLSNSRKGSEPLFVLDKIIKENETEKTIIYLCPGYTVAYSYQGDVVTGGQFHLLGVFLIWAWIA